MKIVKLILWLILSVHLSIFAKDELIPVEQAFSLKASVDKANIILHWDIAKGYYLYKEKINIATDSVEPIGRLVFPPAKIIEDEFFGRIGIYRNSLDVAVPIDATAKKRLNLLVSYQGCADIGVCYPPVEKNITIDITNSILTKKLNQIPAKELKKETTTRANNLPFLSEKNILQKIDRYDDSQPLLPDQAFNFSIVAKDSQTLLASWYIKPDYYLYHDKFNFDVVGAKIGKIDLPKGKIKQDEFFGQIEVHKGRVEVEIPLLAVKQQNIEVIIGYQGCWEGGVCYPPQQQRKSVLLENIKQNNQTSFLKTVPIEEPVKTSITSQPQTNNTLLSEDQNVTQLLVNQNFWFVLIAFFGFGLLLSLTPCVFPMIPILSGIIIGQKQSVSTKYGLLISIAFALSMSLVYAIAGVIAGYWGENLQIVLQTPWVLVMFSLVFVALALSMFGFYDLQMPKYCQDKLGGAQNKQRQGLIGAGIMGALSALIVGPCVAPPLAGALIYIGQTGDAVLGGASLFFMGLGMSVPLILLGASAGKLLPKAGVWMNKVKTIFGIVMLGVAIYLLERVVDEITLLILWASLLTLSMAAMGVLKPLSIEATPLQGMFRAIGLIIFAYGILLFLLVARGGGDMFLPLSDWGNRNSIQAEKSLIFQNIKNTSELKISLDKASKDNKVVMLDFYADWCIACKEIERYVFNDALVKSELKKMVLLKADVTKNSNDDKALMRQFNIIGPPAFLFFRQSKELRPQRIIGEIDKDEFLLKLRYLQTNTSNR